MGRIMVWISVGAVCILAVGSAIAAEKLYDVRDYGAKPGGKTLCTTSIQKAIDACSQLGGGTVYLPPGTFLSGTIYFKTGVTLRLAAGCTLLGSTDLKDYPPTVQAFRSYTDNYTDKSLKLLNVQLQLEKPDQRHAVVFEDVEDAMIDCLDAPLSPDAGEMIRLTDVKKVFIRDRQNKMIEH